MVWIHAETCREFCEAWCIVIWTVYELVLIICVKTYVPGTGNFKSEHTFQCITVGVPLLGAFKKLRKATVNCLMSLCPSVRVEQLFCHWTDFRDIWRLNIFRKSVDQIQVPLKFDKNNGYFMWIAMYICVISRWILFRMRNIGGKSCRENQNTRFPIIVQFMR
jgi:hypothetical protein